VVAETEVTSETKRREGRPARFSDETMAYVAALYPEVRSRRGLVDIAYRLHAISLVKDIPACRWLCDFTDMQRGNDSAWQPGILTELGRINDNDDLIAIAMQVCERQPSRKEAIRFIRRYRTARRPPQNDQLTAEILGVVNDFIQRYPQTTLEAVNDTLGIVQVAVRSAQQDVEQR